MRGVGCSASLKRLVELDLFAGPRSELFFDCLLEHLHAKHRIGIHLLELGIFFLQRLQAFGVGFIHLAVFLPPTMERGDRDLLLTVERLLVEIAAIVVSEQSNDLFWLMSLLHHFKDLGCSNPLTRFGPVF